jgi:hypothetical protein
VQPFEYPSERVTRRHDPGPRTTMSGYKPALREEFAARCVYCRAPDGIKGSENFGADHYRPKKKFPALEFVYTNLFYCCNPCNSHKREFWPEPHQEDTYFIPNPCDHRMAQHLRFDGSTVRARTDAGKCAIEVLDLNDDREAWRPTVMRSIERIERDLVQWRQKLKEADRAKKGAADPAKLAQIEVVQARAQQLIDEAFVDLRRYGAYA